ncbi:hypothetical protein [Streptomyces venezuelae]|uniref:hypothetical protein n=1 Tax=Streptomyces venezuelae TaxID=54571 RepID=UPI0034413CD1
MADATAELPLSFQVPDPFQDLGFQLSPAENTNKLLDKLQSISPKPSDEQIAHAALAQQAMYEMLSSAGAAYAGVLLSGPSPEHPDRPLSSVLLSVIARPSELANEDTVHRLSRTMGALYPEAEVGVVRLKTGPAVLVTEETKVEQPVNLLVDDSAPTRVRQLHVFVPIPGRYAMADFCIATENVDEWDDCVQILARVCDTITFADA